MLKEIIIVKIMDEQTSQSQNTFPEQKVTETKEDLGNTGFSGFDSNSNEHITAPGSIAPETATPEKTEEPQEKLPIEKKVVNPQVGPLFISLKKFNEIKAQIASLKRESNELRQIVEQLKSSRDTGTTLLKNAVDKMEVIEKNVEDINSIIKI